MSEYAIIKEYENGNYGFYNNKGFPSSPKSIRVFNSNKQAKRTMQYLYRRFGFNLEVVDYNTASKFQIEQQDERVRDEAMAEAFNDF